MDTWYSIEVALENGRKKMDCSVNGNRTHGQYMRGGEAKKKGSAFSQRKSKASEI